MADFDFKRYSTPLPTERFSKEFFQSISIEHLVDLPDYPTVAAETSLQTWEWSKHVPCSTIGTSVIPNEIVPNARDLARAYRGMEKAWSRGARSVLVKFHHDGDEYKYLYSFVKMKLIKLVNDHVEPRREFTQLLERLSDPLIEQLGFGLVISEFRRCPSLERLSGFAITRCSLYKLATLLGERWIDQDILDALIEKHYFESYARSNPRSDPVAPAPTDLILPTDFVTDCEQVYQSNGLPGLDALPAGRNLRCRIESTTLSSISICRIQDGHYTSLTFDVGTGTIKYADSMHGEIPPVLGRLISRVLSTSSLHVPSRLERGLVALQGGTNGGEGSCGIAALNFIQQAIDTDTQPWTGPRSQQFRLVALLDLVRYHCIARDRAQAGQSFEAHWAFPASPDVARALQQHGSASVSQYTGSAYCDFNLYTPTREHPIFSFLEQGPVLTVQDSAVVQDVRRGAINRPVRRVPEERQDVHPLFHPPGTLDLSTPQEPPLSHRALALRTADPVLNPLCNGCGLARTRVQVQGVAASISLGYRYSIRPPPRRCMGGHADEISAAVLVPTSGSSPGVSIVLTSTPCLPHTRAGTRPPLHIYSYMY